MKPETKQMALKASLLVILAANVSFHIPKVIQSSDLASVGGETVGSPAATAPARVAKSDLETAAKPAMAPAKLEGPKPDAPISAVSVSAPQTKTKKTVCGRSYEIRYVELTEDGKTVTRVYVRDLGPADAAEGTYAAKDVFTKRYSAPLAQSLTDGKVVSAFNKEIDTYFANTLTCSNDDLVADDTTAPASVARGEPRTKPKRDRDEGDDSSAPDEATRAERIARGLKNCTLDKDGKAVKGEARFNCNLDRLASISLDADENDADRDDESPRRGRRRERRDGIAKVESILRPLKQSIKSDLLSSNEDRQDEGADKLSDVVDALEEVRDTASGADARKIEHMIAEVKSFERAAKVSRESDKYQDRSEAIDERIADLKAQLGQVPMQQQGPYVQALQQLMQTRLSLGVQMGANQDFAYVTSLQQRGIMDLSDYSDFTSGYSTLMNQLQGRATANSVPASVAAPADASTIRTQANSTYAANYGIPSTVPQIDYRALGLQQPGTNTSVVPTAFNPQTTYQPGAYQPQAFNPALNQPSFPRN